MKKVVMKVDLYDDKGKKKALKAVSSISGIESVSVEMKDKKLTVVGDIDPVDLVNKLIKICHTEIITVGPAKEPEKKDDAKKNEKQMQDVIAAYQTYNPYVMRQYVHYSAEENPNSCVIS